MEAALCFGRDIVRVFRKSDDTAWVLRSAGKSITPMSEQSQEQSGDEVQLTGNRFRACGQRSVADDLDRANIVWAAPMKHKL